MKPNLEKRNPSLEDIKEFFNKYDLILLSDSIKDWNSTLKYICKCGKEFESTWYTLQKRIYPYCYECTKIIQNRPKTKSFEEIQEFFTKHNAVILSSKQDYSTMRTKLKVKCTICADIFTTTAERAMRIITYNNFNIICDSCRNTEKLKKIKEEEFLKAKELFKEHGFELLETSYNIKSKKMKCKCKNGHIIYKGLDQISYSCSICSHSKTAKQNSIRHLLNYQEVKEFFEKRNCILLTEYIEQLTIRTPLEYICSCGRHNYTSFEVFRYKPVVDNRVTCKSCGYLNREIREKELYTIQCKEYLNNIGYILLDTNIKELSSTDTLQLICPEGHHTSLSIASLKNGRKCRICTKIELRKKKCGVNHPRYNPNLSLQDRLLNRRYIEYEDWRKAVYSRDLYTCQVCGKTNCKLHAHHKNGFAEHKELRTILENGITLCETCHREFHSLYSVLNNTEEQFNEFYFNKVYKEVDCEVAN